MAEIIQSPDKATAEHRCGHCKHFCNDPAMIEATFQGMSAMCSGHASVRANDGLCDRHGVYLSFRDTCSDFATKTV